MPDILIRGISQEELDALESRAARHDRSTEAELLHLIEEAAAEERLVLELERATQKVDAALAVNRERLGKAGTAEATTSRRRYRSVEPTRNR